MCIFGGRAVPAPPPLPPAPPPPLPPVQPVDPPDPIKKDIDPQVRRAKKDRGKKATNTSTQGTGSLRIKLNPKINTGMGQGNSGGLN